MPEQTASVLCITSNSDRPEAETFIGLKNAGFDMRVMCSPNARHFARLENAGLEVIPLEFERRLDKEAIALIKAEIDARPCDILHLFDNRTVLNGLIAARGHKLKIVTYRGIVGNVSFLDPASWMRYLNPRVDRIVCVAEAVRQFFLQLRFLWLRVPEEKVVRIYKGHDLSWYADSPANLGELGIAGDRFVVCCVVNWRPRKGVEVLVRSFDHLPRDANISLLLVGHMDHAPLLRQIAQSPFKEHIHVIGHRLDAPAVAAACDVLVLPSLKREGLPKCVIEGMAYRVTPIVTDVGGSPELVEHGISGLVVPPNDSRAIAASIARLYGDRALCRAMGEAARERIGTNFKIEKTIEAHIALYRDLLASSRPALPQTP